MSISYRAAQTLIKRSDEVALSSALNQGLDPNLANHKGWTLLMLAAVEGSVPVGELLLAHGANPTLKNITGDTALTIATTKSHTDFATLLASH